MDVVKVGLIFPPNAPTSLDVTVVVPMTLVSFVEGFSTSNCPIVMYLQNFPKYHHPK
jgi:hypothetical protein